MAVHLPRGIALLVVCFSLLAVGTSLPAAENDPAILAIDSQFIKAAAHGEAVSISKLLDKDFTWTDADGTTLSATEAAHVLPKPALGDESGIDVTERTYGDVSAIRADRGNVHVIRLWVKRPEGWKLLVYHEVKQLGQPESAAASGVSPCDNPCKSVPFQPASDSERAIIASWQALETASNAHNSAVWAQHVADEFVRITSNGDHPIDKRGRMEILDKQKVSGTGSAPAPLVSAKMFVFGDTAIMTCLHQPDSGKSVHITRLWLNRNGKWLMAMSYQTAIQADTAH